MSKMTGASIVSILRTIYGNDTVLSAVSPSVLLSVPGPSRVVLTQTAFSPKYRSLTRILKPAAWLSGHNRQSNTSPPHLCKSMWSFLLFVHQYAFSIHSLMIAVLTTVKSRSRTFFSILVFPAHAHNKNAMIIHILIRHIFSAISPSDAPVRLFYSEVYVKWWYFIHISSDFMLYLALDYNEEVFHEI